MKVRIATLLFLGFLLPVLTQAQGKKPNLRVVGATAHSVSFTWTNPTEPVQTLVTNTVYRCSGSGCSALTQIATAVTSPSYTDTAVQPGTNYTYQVTAVCPTTGVGCGTAANPVGGESARSNSVTATTPNDSVAPGAPILNPPTVQ